jgi:hypothetical protein
MTNEIVGRFIMATAESGPKPQGAEWSRAWSDDAVRIRWSRDWRKEERMANAPIEDDDGAFGPADDAEDDWPAIKEALDDIEAGDEGRPAEEVFEDLRREYGL